MAKHLGESTLRGMDVFLKSAIVAACALLVACTAGSTNNGSSFGEAAQPYETGGLAQAPSTGKVPAYGGANANANAVTAPSGNAAPGLAWIGRTDTKTDANATSFSWSGVRFGVHFVGTELSVTLSEQPTSFLGNVGTAWFNVVVDGNALAPFSILDPNVNIYSLVTDLPLGEHTVWVSKRTEGMIGSVKFHGFDLGDGRLLSPPPIPTRRIQVLGASADNGFGDTATNCSGYDSAQQDQDIAWPQLAADGLGAELSNLAFSGKGLAVNFDPINDPSITIPVLFNDADYNIGSPWDFSTWIPDAVLIDAGGNDLTGNGGELPSNFVATYVAFLENLYEKYPGAMVYLVNNATAQGSGRIALATALNAVVSQERLAGHERTSYFEFTQYSGSVFGCDDHPSAALHRQIADEVIARLQSDLPISIK